MTLLAHSDNKSFSVAAPGIASTRETKHTRTNVDIRLIEHVRYIYSCLCWEIDSLDPEANEINLLVSNFADDVAGFLSGADLLREAQA